IDWYGISQEPETNALISVGSIRAPELFKDWIFTEGGNIYSFGLIMYHLSSPFMKDIHEDSNLDITSEGAPKSYVTLMNKCLSNDPTLRPTITQIVNTLGGWYLEVERNIDTPIVIEFRIADEFDPDALPLMGEDISVRSLLSTIRKLGVDLIDINQFTDRKYIGEGGFGSVEKALWRRTNKYIILKRIKNISAINYREHKAFIHELKIHIRLDLMDRIVRMFG
ncbi:746_t:CDS:2, partial [Dentiscutata erythropus]